MTQQITIDSMSNYELVEHLDILYSNEDIYPCSIAICERILQDRGVVYHR